ncbi:MAG: folX [Gammaproteobacteria bacterium]|jgi:dihydroneopterin aldolase|nr:folX [Gammaproteobacteria bacterium]
MKAHARLTLHQLELPLFLGWTEAERSQKQIILLDITIDFNEPPKACISDALEDTNCYDTFIKKIVETITPKSFRLIEHLAYEIHQLIKNLFIQSVLITITVTKKPVLSTLTTLAGVSFSYGDQ